MLGSNPLASPHAPLPGSPTENYPYRGYGFCAGDSGGPLLVDGGSAANDRQVGIVSWGPANCGAAESSPCEAGSGFSFLLQLRHKCVAPNLAVRLCVHGKWQPKGGLAHRRLSASPALSPRLLHCTSLFVCRRLH